jgi:hypothetical protein
MAQPNPKPRAVDLIQQFSNACDAKIRFDTHAHAQARIAAIYGRRRTRTTIVAYRCPFCRGYHIGHPPGSANRDSGV